jgi:hypothetical protein
MSKAFQIRLSDDEHKRWTAKATEFGMSLAAWVRWRCTGDSEGDPDTADDPQLSSPAPEQSPALKSARREPDAVPVEDDAPPELVSTPAHGCIGPESDYLDKAMLERMNNDAPPPAQKARKSSVEFSTRSCRMAGHHVKGCQC